MCVHSAPRQLRYVVSAAALLLAGTQFAQAQLANRAKPSADLDTLIMASLQTSGQSASSNSKSDAKTADSAKSSQGKPVSAKSAASKKAGNGKTAEKKYVPAPAPVAAIVQPRPQQQGGGGLLSAIGAWGGSPSAPSEIMAPRAEPKSAAIDGKSSSVESKPGSVAFKPESGSTASGSAVYVTSGYGQSESRTSSPYVTPSLSVSAPSRPVSAAPKIAAADKSHNNVSTVSSASHKPGSSVAPLAVASSAPPAPSVASSESSGIGAFLTSLGFTSGSSSTEASNESSANSSLSPSASASSSSSKDRSKSDVSSTASVSAPSSSSSSSPIASSINSWTFSGSSTASSAPASNVSSASSSSNSQSGTSSKTTAPASVAAKPAASEKPGSVATSASLDQRSHGAKDQAKSDVATTASIASPLSSASSTPSQSSPIPGKPAPVVWSRAPASVPASSSSSNSGGGLLAALGAQSGSTAEQVETTAQIPTVAPPPVIVAHNVMPIRQAVAMAPVDSGYRVDAGDKLRVVVFGQEGLTNTYAIDAGGGITMPLIGRVTARGQTPAGLAADITGRLRRGYIREPSVAVEVETYRPFFILGEVAAPGQYPYVPNMSVESAVAIAGGFSPRARRDSVTLTHRADGGQYRDAVPLGTPLSPGDTITVGERWF